jgi:hypothetical protein
VVKQKGAKSRSQCQKSLESPEEGAWDNKDLLNGELQKTQVHEIKLY